MVDLVEERRDAYLEKMRKEEADKVAALLKQYPVNTWAPIELGVAVVLLRGDQEIMFFHQEKDAGAWMQHVYGCVPWGGRSQGVAHPKYKSMKLKTDGKGYDTEWETITDLLTIKPIKDRGPKAGDLLIYLNDGEYYHHGTGLLDHCYGRDTLSVTFDGSGYREGNSISNSGGPSPAVNPADLTYDGLRQAHYWRWWDGSAGGGQGGHYTLTVPSWRWNGNRAEPTTPGQPPCNDGT